CRCLHGARRRYFCFVLPAPRLRPTAHGRRPVSGSARFESAAPTARFESAAPAARSAAAFCSRSGCGRGNPPGLSVRGTSDFRPPRALRVVSPLPTSPGFALDLLPRRVARPLDVWVVDCPNGYDHEPVWGRLADVP